MCCWRQEPPCEGFDFPGNCASLLIIHRPPLAVPDALKEKERENHPAFRLFIRAVKGNDYFMEAAS